MLAKSSSHFLALTTLSLAIAHAQSVDVYVTAKGTAQRLSQAPALELAPREALTEKLSYLFVDPARSFQTVLGIGGALTDAAAETYYKLPEAKRRELIRAYYDPEHGIGYSLARTHIHSCDFSSASYTYVEEGDASLRSFSIAPDLKYRVPMIKEALATARGGLTIYASPWSPPGWMKDNHHMLRGGKLKPEFRDTWARYYVEFIKAYEAAGIPIWGLTVQNEPMAVQRWESCIFTAEEERDFVRDHLGPTLAKSGFGEKKLTVWDHNRTLMYERARVMLDDPAAAKYVWGVGYHWYVNDTYENVARVHEAFPHVNLLFTEGCNYPFDRAKLDDWKLGERYGESMIRDFNAGAVGWTDWNVLLDETGGPNHVANFCYAPVHADTKTGELIYTNAFYYLGHFSKFVRPGARRIVSSSTVDAVLTTAFVNSDGSIVVVAMNATAKDQPLALCVGTKAVLSSCPANAIVTFKINR
jgi:glucosylceramidase